MNKFARFLDTIPAPARWVLFLPVGLAASFIVVGLFNAAFDAYWGNPRPMPGMIETSSLAFAAALTRTLFPAVLSPRPWPVGIMMFALDFLLRAGPIAYSVVSYEYVRARAPLAAVVVAAGVAGGLVGLYLVRRTCHSSIWNRSASR